MRQLAALRRQAVSRRREAMRRSSSATAWWRSSASLLTLIVWLAARRVDGLPRWVRNVALVTAARDDRADSARRHHGAPRPQSDRGDVPLPARAARPGRGDRRRARGVESLERPRRRRRARAGCARSPRSVSPPAPSSSSPGRSRPPRGPHSGGQDIRRLGLGVTDTVYVHVRATAVFGIGFLVVGFFLWRLRRELPGSPRPAPSCSGSS